MSQGDWPLHGPVRRKPGVVWKTFEREIAILDPRTGRLGTLNEVAARCWELADGRTLSDMLDALVNEFDVERNELEADVRAFLEKLRARGLLED
jgi:hypothetical protein